MKSIYTILFSLFAIICFGQTSPDQNLIDAELVKLTKQYSLNDEQKELVMPLLVVKHEGILVAQKLNKGVTSEKQVMLNVDFYKSFNEIITPEQKRNFKLNEADKRNARAAERMVGQKSSGKAVQSQGTKKK